MKYVSVGFLVVGQSLISNYNICAFQLDFRATKWSRGTSVAAMARARNNSSRRRRLEKKQEFQTTNAGSLPYNQLKTKKIQVPFETNHDSVILVQVDDKEYWATNENPFGAKVWPAALATANLLHSHGENVCDKPLLELGCGTGLVSLVAAKRGAHVVATDVSTFALSLVRQGWETTMKESLNNDDSLQVGALDTRVFDITSSEPLSSLLLRDNPESQQPIVVATTMMYQPQLAKALACRVAEAYHELGAWIVIGDDDTGSIARLEFETLLEQLLGASATVEWREATVASTEFGWKQKNTRIFQLNSPLR